MSMDLLVKMVQLEVWGFVLGLAALVFYKLLTGQINTDGLLNTKFGPNKGKISPERVQLLLVTLGAAFYYLMQVQMTAPKGELPKVPDGLPEVLGGSNALYLGGKFFNRFFADSTSKKDTGEKQ
jgi:hypothetical protein